MDGTLPSNLDDPRFAGQDQEKPLDRTDDSAAYWMVRLFEGLLEALPQVLERIVPR